MNIVRALKHLRPNAKFTFQGVADYDHLSWFDSSPKPSLNDIEAVDLASAKAERIIRAKIEAFQRITAQWPVYAQNSAALGVYDDLPEEDPFNPETMKDGIKAIIDAEHSAETAINSLTSALECDMFTW